jgi:hypothetical protein
VLLHKGQELNDDKLLDQIDLEENPIITVCGLELQEYQIENMPSEEQFSDSDEAEKEIVELDEEEG